MVAERLYCEASSNRVDRREFAQCGYSGLEGLSEKELFQNERKAGAYVATNVSSIFSEFSVDIPNLCFLSERNNEEIYFQIAQRRAVIEV